jgi:1-deoxy-D-xylulose-5-phosphate reductoisomerase
MRNVFIVGSTGALGKEAVEVIDLLGNDYRLIGITGFNNYSLLVEQATIHKVKFVGASKNVLTTMKTALSNVQVFDIVSDLEKVLFDASPDITLFLSSGITALPSISSLLSKGLTVAIANKESIIAGGDLVFNSATRPFILPIDSEASAIFQALIGESIDCVKRLIITASGGPFVDFDKSSLSGISADLALKHPNWKMGKKITIDSATMVNKAFEVMESHFLFDIPYDKIDVLVHRESIVHSLVEFLDGFQKAILSVPTMLFSIQNALTYPKRIVNAFPKLKLENIGRLSFELLDTEKFKAFSTVLEYGMLGGNFLPILVATDEILVEAFLDRKIGFEDINDYMRKIMDSFDHKDIYSYEEIKYFYEEALLRANEIVRRYK